MNARQQVTLGNANGHVLILLELGVKDWNQIANSNAICNPQSNPSHNAVVSG